MKQLLPFQEAGVNFLSNRYHAALGDEPGLGKTVQAIHAAHRVAARNVLVTCPASVRTNWLAHVEEHFGHIRGWDIISYEGAVAGKARRDQYDVWIGDETHFCKTPDSARTRAIFGRDGLARRARFKWCLSGTFAPNGRPVELYPMLATLCSSFAGLSYAEYTRLYCGAFFDGHGMNVKGATRIDELKTRIGDFLLRRTKKEVFPGRKAPLISTVALDLSEADLKEVRGEENAIGARPARISGRFEDFSQLGDTSKLLRLLGSAMLPGGIQFIDDLLSSRNKVVVFARHLVVMKELEYRYPTASVYQGGMTDLQKLAAVSRFKNASSCRIFIGQRQAAGTGINGLQDVCSTAVIFEPSWVPGETEQLVDRLDRMGQLDDIVTVYILYARRTLSEIVVKIHERKSSIGAQLLGGE